MWPAYHGRYVSPQCNFLEYPIRKWELLYLSTGPRDIISFVIHIFFVTGACRGRCVWYARAEVLTLRISSLQWWSLYDATGLSSLSDAGRRKRFAVCKIKSFFSNFCVSHWEKVWRLLYYSARKNDHNVKNLNNYWKFMAGKRKKIVVATGTFPWDRSGHARKVINENSVTKILWSGKAKNKW